MSLKNLSAKTKIHKFFKNKLNNKKINQIYKRFESSLNINENFVVAVSGGPDSLALAFLSKVYSIKKKLKPQYFIIDHKLRPESTKEAQIVKQLLKQIFVDSKILTWKGKKPSKNIQSAARFKRFNLLFRQSDKFKIKNILMGHHQDDVLENFLIRIFRGSGLKGLVSMDFKGKEGNKNLLRPLLNEKKEDLVFLTKNIFDFYISDPSNKDEKYLRVKIRRLIEELKKNGFDKKKFLKTVNNLKYSNKVVDFYVSENIKKNTFFSNKNNKLILNINFFQQPHEIIFRALSESIKLVGKKYYSVRGRKLDKIIHDVNNCHSFRVTLGGCIIEKVNQTVIISKEH